MIISENNKKALYVFLAFLCALPFISSASALILGILFSLTIQNPYSKQIKSLTTKLLAISIVGLGAGVNLALVYEVGRAGIWYTAVSITLTLVLGILIAKKLKINQNISLLISTGTAICGGSAIAACAPVVNAKSEEISISLAAIFILNAIALIIFPPIGEAFNLTGAQFGLWSALAIHDTSSVIGAAIHYGNDAVATATTIKLTRALWIMPVALLIGIYIRAKDNIGLKDNDQTTSKKGKIKIPWFIFGFIAMAAVMTWIPALTNIGITLEFFAKRLLVVTLFLIGSGLSLQSIKNAGYRSFIFALTLWLIVASISLIAIKTNFI